MRISPVVEDIRGDSSIKTNTRSKIDQRYLQWESYVTRAAVELFTDQE